MTTPRWEKKRIQLPHAPYSDSKPRWVHQCPVFGTVILTSSQIRDFNGCAWCEELPPGFTDTGRFKLKAAA